jgi:hypothetical protein
MIINLVTKSDLDGFKYIADSARNVGAWPQFVSEAQLFDIKHWLGDALLMEIIGQASTNPTTFSIANQTLLNGGTYVYQGCTYFFQGLKACIIYYAFARMTNRISFNYTAAGIVLKDSDLSTPATTKDIQRLETEARLMGDALKCDIQDYLNRNNLTYPLWTSLVRCGSQCSDNRPFTVIGD